MEKILCVYCGDLFDSSPKHKSQTACKKPQCQRAKKAEWQRHKMKTDPVYNASQKISHKQWASVNPDYWKRYRNKNPDMARSYYMNCERPYPHEIIRDDIDAHLTEMNAVE